jgi:hypothetical protein
VVDYASSMRCGPRYAPRRAPKSPASFRRNGFRTRRFDTIWCFTLAADDGTASRWRDVNVGEEMPSGIY